MKKGLTQHKKSMMGVVIVIALAVLPFLFIRFLSTDHVLVRAVSSVMPAASVNTFAWVSLADVARNRDAIEHKYQDPALADVGLRADFSTQEGKKRLAIKQKDVINKLIEDRVVQRLAKSRGIIVSEEDVTQNIDKQIRVQELSREKITKRIEQEFGWSIDEFANYIVRPTIYREKLETAFANEYAVEPKMRQKIAQAQKELEDGRVFGDIAQKFSEGESAKDGGDIGWFARGQLTPEVADVAFGMTPEEVSDVIESPLGFHIIRLNNVQERDNKKIVHLSQVVVRKNTFADWLEDQMRTMRISVPLKDFYWDDTQQVVEFRDAGMRAFEKKSRENISGDASLLF